MRILNKKQKNLLNEWFEKNKDNLGLFFQVDTCEAFSPKLFEQLEKINDHETLYQNIDRYISDKVADLMYS